MAVTPRISYPIYSFPPLAQNYQRPPGPTRNRPVQISTILTYLAGAACTLFLLTVVCWEPARDLAVWSTLQKFYGEEALFSARPDNPIYDSKFSIVVSTYDRFEHLLQFLNHYGKTDIPDLEAIHISWGLGDDHPPPEALRLDAYRVPIYLDYASVDSLTERFRTGQHTRTSSVLLLDDDVILSVDALSLGWEAWKGHGMQTHRIVGYMPRKHVHYQSGGHLYTFDTKDGYSMILTSAAFVDHTMLRWFWAATRENALAIQYVDQHLNCEDILFNEVVSARTGQSPLLVNVPPGSIIAIRSEGISSKPDHFIERSYCLARFYHLYGNVLKMSRLAIGPARNQRVAVHDLDKIYSPIGSAWGENRRFRRPYRPRDQ